MQKLQLNKKLSNIQIELLKLYSTDIKESELMVLPSFPMS